MNQLLVRSNGGAGRALFKFAGARALSVPACSASTSAAVGVYAAGAGCDGAVEQPPRARLKAAAATRIVVVFVIDGLVVALLGFRRAEARGTLEQLAAIGQRQRHEDAGGLAAADRVHHDGDLVARLDDVRLPPG